MRLHDGPMLGRPLTLHKDNMLAHLRLYKNTDMRKLFVIQTPWKLSDIYNMVYSLVLTNKNRFPQRVFSSIGSPKLGT